ncbi:MAG: trypsin-like peptidase domain-containing protein [Chloroflexi bacterium]|nr:trypsin-like peptidase domain-containing protein [Chloroflexota bacterium]
MQPAGPPPPPTGVGRARIIAAGTLIVVASLAAGVLGGKLTGPNEEPVAERTTVIPTTDPTGTPAPAGPDFRSIYDAISPAVVVLSTRKGRERALGSGVITDAAGIIITNNHVVPDDEVRVSLADGTDYEGVVLGRHPTSDLAVVQIVDAPPGLPTAPLGDASILTVGDPVAAIGAPYALRGTLTTGVISALNRTFPGDGEIPRIEGLIQTDASINPGNSGGPLLNEAGEVVGINTAIQSPIEGSVGIGFAVPIETVRRVLAAIANRV